jgi:hypothetical protein
MIGIGFKVLKQLDVSIEENLNADIILEEFCAVWKMNTFNMVLIHIHHYYTIEYDDIAKNHSFRLQ